MCFRGCDISIPPACSTNSAGENELPWQTQMMLTSDLEYLYKNPVMVFPFGPLPVVETQGICARDAAFWSWFWGLGGLPMIPFDSFEREEAGWLEQMVVVWSELVSDLDFSVNWIGLDCGILDEAAPTDPSLGSILAEETLLFICSNLCELLELLPVSLLLMLPPENRQVFVKIKSKTTKYEQGCSISYLGPLSFSMYKQVHLHTTFSSLSKSPLIHLSSYSFFSFQ